MNRVSYVSINRYFQLHPAKQIDLVKLGLISESDVRELHAFINAHRTKISSEQLIQWVGFLLRNPTAGTAMVSRLINSRNADVSRSDRKLLDDPIIGNCNMKSRIMVSLRPRSITEIGTYLGWGAACFKFTNPKAVIHTVNPHVDVESNNPITKRDVGSFCRKKHLPIKQIWADSTKYTGYKKTDAWYIDGNHAYKYVYADLMNGLQYSRKAIVLDDYIPRDAAFSHHMAYGPWNENVVRAVQDFLLDYGQHFHKTLWVVNTPYCVLLKA